MQTVLPGEEPPVTLTQFILNQQSINLFANEKTSGSFVMLLQSIQLACKVISSHVNKSGIARDMGLGAIYSHQGGLQTKKLSDIAHDTMVDCLENSKQVSIIASQHITATKMLDSYQNGYAVTVDPLDGVSNIDANVSVGTIFAIYKKDPNGSQNVTSDDNVLRPGRELMCAGYTLYGGATILVLTTGMGVNGFLLDATLGEFILTHPNMRIPKKGKMYSLNEGNSLSWDAPTQTFHTWLKKADPETGFVRSGRYVGSMVADVHRTLLYGGIFCYPASMRHPNGKLGVLYECNPMAFIIEQAGGKATTGMHRILDIEPESIHQSTPIYLGSMEEMSKLESIYYQLPSKL